MKFPARQAQDALHGRVLNGDPVSSADLFELFVQPMSDILKRSLKSSSEDLVYDSIIDALFTYLRQPDAYDPQRGQLSTLLTEVARRKLVDRLRTRDARLTREKKFAEDVELLRTDPNEQVEAQVDAEAVWPKVRQALPNASDQICAQEIMKGESDTDRLASILGLSSLPPLARKREVKKHRDRILKTLQRIGSKLK
jgi:RNA polymerase sigma-70 factor, ECF subfamily